MTKGLSSNIRVKFLERYIEYYQCVKELGVSFVAGEYLPTNSIFLRVATMSCKVTVNLQLIVMVILQNF